MTDHEKLVQEYTSWARGQFLEDVYELYMDNDRVKEPAEYMVYEEVPDADLSYAIFDEHYRAALDAYTQVARSARVVFEEDNAH